MKSMTKVVLAALCAIFVVGLGVANASSPTMNAGPAVISSVDSAPQAVVSNIPKLGSPKNGYASYKMPKFSWKKLKGAVSHQIQVARDPDFTDIVFDESGLPKPKHAAAPFEYGVFYWHVIEQYGDGSFSEWSETRTYTVTIMKSPKNGGKAKGNTVWKWKKVPDAQYYVLDITTDPTFSSYTSYTIPARYSGARWAGVPFPSGSVWYWRLSASNTPYMPWWSYQIK